MFTVTQPFPQDASQPLAIISGEMIYIVHPNGEVQTIFSKGVDRGKNKTLLEKCLVWGDLAIA